MAQISRQIGWGTESNLLYQILKQLNKLTSIMFGLKPKYKVYTALLTQSGGSDVQSLSSGAVTKGVTYQISGIDGNFSNVGAPNNNESTFFVAINDEIPNSYGTSELKFNTGAPVVTVLENTIGNIWFTYDDVGLYFANSISLFAENKTTVNIDNFPIFQDIRITSTYFIRDISNIYLSTIKDSVVANGILTQNKLEIRVYN
jgi:hypothetical protein